MKTLLILVPSAAVVITTLAKFVDVLLPQLNHVIKAFGH